MEHAIPIAHIALPVLIGIGLLITLCAGRRPVSRLRPPAPADLADPPEERVGSLQSTNNEEPSTPAEELVPIGALQPKLATCTWAKYRHPATGHVQHVTLDELLAAQRRRLSLPVWRAAHGRANEHRRN